MTEQSNVYAQNTPTSPTSGYNSLRFAIDAAKNAMMTCTIVKVTKVTTNGQVAGVGRVHVQPLVQMVDGVQQTVDHTTVHNLPYLRMIGGSKAIILDPKDGDIGIVVVADRDISGVKKSKKVAPPGSLRRYNISDGMFIGSVLADAPTSYIQFQDDGTIVLSPDNGTTVVTIKKNLITAAIGPAASSAQLVVAPTHVQMKKRGTADLHLTVDIAGHQILTGMDLVTAPDPYPGD